MRLTALLLVVLALPGSGAAQTAGVEDYIAEAERQLGVDPRCPPQAPGEDIVVCGRRMREAERYRLPIRPDRFDPDGPVASVSRERNALFEHDAGGVATCSTVGPGGMYGCAFRDFKRELEQHAK